MRLKLNIKKTKLIIFSNRCKVKGQNFTFGTEKIAIVYSYTFLGITFTKNGNLNEAVNTLCDKSKKGMVSLCRLLYTGFTISPTLPLKIFNSTIRPMLAYGLSILITSTSYRSP